MKFDFDNIIRAALNEDAPFGDITTEATIPENKKAKGSFIAKADGVICGLEIVRRVFELLEGKVIFEPLVKDGDFVKSGDVIAQISGDARTILVGERTALNLMQRASGIATTTRAAVDQVAGYKTRITDTRKTVPGLRALDKYAVRVGGGYNHRYGLSDAVLIKDNHIAACGGIKAAVLNARNRIPHTMRIEVEVETFLQLYEALEAKPDIIMLDNMNDGMLEQAIRIINGRAITEASGNMSDRNLADVAATGVDYISIGALTHSVKALDISLRLKIT